VVEEAPHERFHRVKDDLIVDVKLPWAKPPRDEKVEVSFEGLDGEVFEVAIDYPAGKTGGGGHVFPGAGMPVRRRGKVMGRGDLIVRCVSCLLSL